MSTEWKTLQVPYPESKASHSIFYRIESALEIVVFNLPLATNKENLTTLLESIFSLFGHIDDITFPNSESAVIKFQSHKGLERAINQKKKHSREIPYARSGVFGLERYVRKYHELHPDVEVLERVSREYIEQFEKREEENRKVTKGRKVMRLTEAEKNEMMNKYRQKVKRMQSNDFYSFQMRGKLNLATGLISNDGPAPRHLKKKPKEKHHYTQPPKKEPAKESTQ